MVLRTVITMLGVAVILRGGTARSGDVQTLDPGGTDVLKPVSVYRDRTHLLSDNTVARYGLAKNESLFLIRDDEEPNASYRRQVPFPQITFTRTEPFNLETGYSGPGVGPVTAFRREWSGRLPGGGLSAGDRRVVWTWQPPPDIRKSYPAWAYRSGKERYAAICLYPPEYPPAWKRDPAVFYFDSLKGLQWQTALPVVTNPGVNLGGPAGDPSGPLHCGDEQRVQLGITPDGERVIALVFPYPDRNTTWLYIIDGDGAIVHSVVLPERMGVVSDTSFRAGHILRAGQGFILNFVHKLPAPVEGLPDPNSERESYLVDRDGKFLCRFVDEDGRAVRISRAGEHYAAGWVARKDGTFDHLIYRLP
jgi:hypothetical protein